MSESCILQLHVQLVRRPLRHLVAYGSTNKYSPVTNCKASVPTATRPTLAVYLPCTTATRLTMTATVKAIDSQRWICRIHLFQPNRPPLETSCVLRIASFFRALTWVKHAALSRLFPHFRRPARRFDTELLRILGDQSLPTPEPHCVAAADAANRLTGEQPI
jgi:hypothetical protein